MPEIVAYHEDETRIWMRFQSKSLQFNQGFCRRPGHWFCTESSSTHIFFTLERQGSFSIDAHLFVRVGWLNQDSSFNCPCRKKLTIEINHTRDIKSPLVKQSSAFYKIAEQAFVIILMHKEHGVALFPHDIYKLLIPFQCISWTNKQTSWIFINIVLNSTSQSMTWIWIRTSSGLHREIMIGKANFRVNRCITQ